MNDSAKIPCYRIKVDPSVNNTIIYYEVDSHHTKNVHLLLPYQVDGRFDGITAAVTIYDPAGHYGKKVHQINFASKLTIVGFLPVYQFATVYITVYDHLG